MFLLRKRGAGGERERERERGTKVIAARRAGREREKNGEKAWNGEPSVSESKEARPGRKQSEYANGIISALSEKRATRAFCMQPRRAAKRKRGHGVSSSVEGEVRAEAAREMYTL